MKDQTVVYSGFLDLSISLRILDIKRRIQALEMWYYRTIFISSYVDRITNDSVRDTIRWEAATLEDLISTVKKRKLKCYGYIIKVNLSTATLQGSTWGKRRNTVKMSWQRHWVDWKLIHEDSDTGTQLRYRELVKCSTYQRSYDHIRSWTEDDYMPLIRPNILKPGIILSFSLDFSSTPLIRFWKIISIPPPPFISFTNATNKICSA